ncbi:MAG TPA: hypothetical protein VJ553_07415 [Candidatus Paceibacterota bacterium]|nr:hypothetical protein [Candidatus Paceibacterota bacterium]
MLTVPLQAYPAYEFRTELDGYLFVFRVLWLGEPEQWIIDVDIDELDIHCHGLALVTGRDLLFGRGLYQLGMLALIDQQGNDDPDFAGLGDRWKLVYVPLEEIE